MHSKDVIDALAEAFDPEEVEAIATSPTTQRDRIENALQGIATKIEWISPVSLDALIPHRHGTLPMQILKSIDPEVTGMSMDYNRPRNAKDFKVRYHFPSLMYGNVGRSHGTIHGRVMPPRPA